MSPSLSSIQGIINGVMGDKLAQANNELAIQMGFYHQGLRLDLEKGIPARINAPLSNKIVILVHGLTNIEAIWDYPKDKRDKTKLTNYGLKLQQDHGFTPFFLRYNTGLSIEENGQRFSEEVETLVSKYPISIDEIALIGFSMGGLVSRCAQAIHAPWLKLLRVCVYIGTPHEGAPSAKFGHYASKVFGEFPQPYFNTWEDVINNRSQGVKDLRHGLKDQTSKFKERSQHCFVSGDILDDKHNLLNRLLGDSLVRKPSAAPVAAPPGSFRAHFGKRDHLSLAHCDEVYSVINQWFTCLNNGRETVYADYKAVVPVGSQTNEMSARDIAMGSAKLAVDVFDGSVNKVDLMFHSIGNETYNALSKIPPVKPVSEAIKHSQSMVSNSVFAILRTASKATKNQLAKFDV